MTTSTTNLYRETIFEQYLMAFVFRLSVWLPPLIPAYMAAKASMEYLGFEIWMAISTGIMIEALGMAACHNMLTFERKAQSLSNRSIEDVAKSRVARSRMLSGFYLSTIILIVLVLKIFPVVANWALLLLTLASPVGAMVYLMRSEYTKEEDEERFKEQLNAESLQAQREFELEEAQLTSELQLEKRRMEFEIEKAKMQNQIERLRGQLSRSKQTQKPDNEQHPVDSVESHSVDDEQLSEVVIDQKQMITEQLQAGRQAKTERRREQLLSIAAEEPDIAVAELARRLDAARNTVAADLKALEEAGRITRNGVIEVHTE